MGKKRVHLYIEGIVQGVFYRAFTRDLALRNGLTGWVRNLPDGRVEVVFEGDEDAVAKAVTECYKGPPGARVRDIEMFEEPYRGEFGDFTIRYF